MPSSLSTLCLAVLGLLCSPARGRETTAAQYCHDDRRTHQRTFCVASNTRHNTTTGATDLFVTFGHERSENGGWASVGLGSAMLGALMFVTYAPESSNDELILSVRAGKGHLEPRPSDVVPAVETLRASLNESSWFETSFVCYSCDLWAGETLRHGTQPWIWALNSAQAFEQATVESRLRGHSRFGSFSLQVAGHEQDVASDAADIPSIDFSLPNQDSHGGGDPGRTTYGAWVPVHGSFLALGMLILFPCGAVAIRSGSKKSFKAHLYFQIAASVCCLVGATVAMFAVGLDFSVDSSIKSHMLAGTVLVLLIPLQISLGYLHHRAYKFSRQSPKTTKGHIWIGRLIVLGGCLNAMLGLRLAGASTINFVLVSMVALIDVSVVIALSYLATRESARKTKEISAEEDSVPFLPLSP